MKTKRTLYIVFISALITTLTFAGAAVALTDKHQCRYCHTLHDSPAGGQLLYDATVQTVCLTCHGPNSPDPRMEPIIGSPVTGITRHKSMTCRRCHSGHDNKENIDGTVNIMMIGDIVDSDGYAKIRYRNGPRFFPVVYTSQDSTDVNGPAVIHDDSRSPVTNGGDSSPYTAYRVCTICHPDILPETEKVDESNLHYGPEWFADNPGETPDHANCFVSGCHTHQRGFSPP